jgi:acyl carrier protein phosphodiesterase
LNYLAHLALAAPDEELMVGGFLGDFLKGPVAQSWEPGIRRGVNLHRAIDAYSDRHAQLAETREILPDEWRRFSGILLDMLTDHYLASHWSEFHTLPLEEFIRQSEQTLLVHVHLFPDTASQAMERIYRYRWLQRYADIDFTLAALSRIGKRMRFDNPLHRCGNLVPQYYAELCACCHLMYVDTSGYVAEWRAEHMPDMET